MNADALESAFRAHTAGQTKFTRRMAIAIADMFGETPRQTVLRLERRGLLKRGSWDWFAANGGITKENIAECRAGRGATPKACTSRSTECAYYSVAKSCPRPECEHFPPKPEALRSSLNTTEKA